LADKIVDGRESRQDQAIFVVGGCDGAEVGRNYFSEFAAKRHATHSC